MHRLASALLVSFLIGQIKAEPPCTRYSGDLTFLIDESDVAKYKSSATWTPSTNTYDILRTQMQQFLANLAQEQSSNGVPVDVRVRILAYTGFGVISKADTKMTLDGFYPGQRNVFETPAQLQARLKNHGPGNVVFPDTVLTVNGTSTGGSWTYTGLEYADKNLTVQAGRRNIITLISSLGTYDSLKRSKAKVAADSLKSKGWSFYVIGVNNVVFPFLLDFTELKDLVAGDPSRFININSYNDLASTLTTQIKQSTSFLCQREPPTTTPPTTTPPTTTQPCTRYTGDLTFVVDHSEVARAKSTSYSSLLSINYFDILRTQMQLFLANLAQEQSKGVPVDVRVRILAYTGFGFSSRADATMTLDGFYPGQTNVFETPAQLLTRLNNHGPGNVVFPDTVLTLSGSSCGGSWTYLGLEYADKNLTVQAGRRNIITLISSQGTFSPVKRTKARVAADSLKNKGWTFYVIGVNNISQPQFLDVTELRDTVAVDPSRFININSYNDLAATLTTQIKLSPSFLCDKSTTAG